MYSDSTCLIVILIATLGGLFGVLVGYIAGTKKNWRKMWKHLQTLSVEDNYFTDYKTNEILFITDDNQITTPANYAKEGLE